ncbi:MAG: ATP-binding protein [Candidatus Gracilibacteria bacterium]
MEYFQTSLYFLTIVIVFGTAISILFYNFRSKVNRIFFYYLISTFVWLLTLYLAIPTYEGYTVSGISISARIAYGAAALFPYFVLLFLSKFVFSLESIDHPVIKSSKKYIKFFQTLLGVETFLLAFISVFTPLIYQSTGVNPDGSIVDYFGPLIDWSSQHHYFYFVLCLIIPTIKIFFAEGLPRKKLIMLFVTYLCCYGLTILCNVILPNFGKPDYYLLGGIATAPFALITVYIIVHYRFLGTKIIFSNVLRIVLSLGVALFTAYIFDNTILYLLKNISLRLSLNAIIAIASFYMIRFTVLKTKYQGSFQKSIDDLIEDLKFTSEFNEFSQNMRIAFTQKLGISGAEIFITNEKTEHRFFPIYPENELTDILKRDRKPLVTEELEFSERPLSEEYYKALVHLSILHASVCIPLFFRTELIGFLTLGKKFSQDMYFLEELEALSSLSDYIAIFLVNDSLRHEGTEKSAQLKRSEEVFKTNELVKKRMHDMKNSLQSAMAVIRDIKVKESDNKVLKIEKNLWEMEDKLSLKDDTLHKKIISAEDFFQSEFLSHQDLMKEKEIDFTLESIHLENEFLYADRSKLHSICENLLNNAYKFTPNKGKVVLCVEKKMNVFIIDFINTGNGILPTHKEKIFEQGFTTDTERGSGIGLATVKEYIEMHNGSIEEIGTAGVETHFRIILPYEEPSITLFPTPSFK